MEQNMHCNANWLMEAMKKLVVILNNLPSLLTPYWKSALSPCPFELAYLYKQFTTWVYVARTVY